MRPRAVSSIGGSAAALRPRCSSTARRSSTIRYSAQRSHGGTSSSSASSVELAAVRRRPGAPAAAAPRAGSPACRRSRAGRRRGGDSRCARRRGRSRAAARPSVSASSASGSSSSQVSRDLLEEVAAPWPRRARPAPRRRDSAAAWRARCARAHPRRVKRPTMSYSRPSRIAPSAMRICSMPSVLERSRRGSRAPPGNTGAALLGDRLEVELAHVAGVADAARSARSQPVGA